MPRLEIETRYGIGDECWAVLRPRDLGVFTPVKVRVVERGLVEGRWCPPGEPQNPDGWRGKTPLWVTVRLTVEPIEWPADTLRLPECLLADDAAGAIGAFYEHWQRHPQGNAGAKVWLEA